MRFWWFMKSYCFCCDLVPLSRAMRSMLAHQKVSILHARTPITCCSDYRLSGFKQGFGHCQSVWGGGRNPPPRGRTTHCVASI